MAVTPKPKTEGMRKGSGWRLKKGKDGHEFKGTLMGIVLRGGQRIAVFSVPKRSSKKKAKAKKAKKTLSTKKLHDKAVADVKKALL